MILFTPILLGTHTLHAASAELFIHVSSGSPLFLNTSLIACSNYFELNRPWILPWIVIRCAFLLKHLIGEGEVASESFVDRHFESAKQDGNQPNRSAIMSNSSSLLTKPPVLVPPIMSNYWQGLGGHSGLLICISCSRIISDDNPRTPPPSRASSRSS